MQICQSHRANIFVYVVVGPERERWAQYQNHNCRRLIFSIMLSVKNVCNLMNTEDDKSYELWKYNMRELCHEDIVFTKSVNSDFRAC